MDKETYLNIFERYISGEATSEEVSQLRMFLKNDTELNKWMEAQVLGSSAAMDSDIKERILKHIDFQTNYSTYREVVPESNNKNFRRYLKYASNVAAILLPFAIVLSLYLYFGYHKVESFEVIADMGEKASVTLPEGSKVALNSGSKVIYTSDYNSKSRNIQLEGEAYFDISHNPKKPFIVECKGLRIKILGTCFGVKAYENEDNISVVLNSGKIQLITPKEEIEMEPNDRVIYNSKTQTTSLERVNAEDYTSWRQNRLRFENESLETIISTISRMHNIDIIFEDSDLKHQIFTGTIDNTSIVSVLDAIKLTSPVNYKLKAGVVYLYEKK